MSKTTLAHCFSNGTEFMEWTSKNCDRCWKQSKDKGNDEYTKFYCSIDRDIQAQAAGLQEISQRSYDITQKHDCPYRQEKRPKKRTKLKVKEENSMLNLF